MLINGVTGNMISIRDRGLLYGDGVFRTLVVRDGKPQHWQRHYQKIRHDCTALGIVCPDFEILSVELAGLALEHSNAVFKLIVTRGQFNGHGDEARHARFPHPNPLVKLLANRLSPQAVKSLVIPEGEGTNERSREFKIKRGYAPDPHALPTHIWDVAPLPVYPDTQQGVTLSLCTLRLGHQPRLAGIKHLNRLENVLAAAECADADEGLLLDCGGLIIAAMCFWYLGGG
jgi:4-amino-4-deoxychorismate lyase